MIRLEEIENSIYDSLIVAENDIQRENETNDMINKFDICVYSFALIVILMIVSFLMYLAYTYFKTW